MSSEEVIDGSTKRLNRRSRSLLHANIRFFHCSSLILDSKIY